MKSEKWRVKSEQRSLIIDHWTLNIEHWYWHEVFCVCRRGELQFAHIAIRPMLLRAFLPQIVHIAIRPCCKFIHITIRPCFQLPPHVGGLIAISPYTCVFWTFANIHVNTQKKHHGHGMSMFACVVGANCNSPILQFALVTNSPTLQIHPHCKFTHVFNCPDVGGLIAISPYTCVFWTFANIHVNTCKYTCKYTEKHHGHGVSMFTCVVGAICKSPLQRALFSGSKNC